MTRTNTAGVYCRRHGPRRGAGFLALSMALLAVIAAATTSLLLVTAVRAKQSAYERNAVQALHAAEAGVETTLATLAHDGRLPQPLTGQCGDAEWEVTVSIAGDRALLEGTGRVKPPVGRTVLRRVQVAAVRSAGAYHMTSWRRVPVPEAQPLADDEPGAPDGDRKG